MQIFNIKISVMRMLALFITMLPTLVDGESIENIRIVKTITQADHVIKIEYDRGRIEKVVVLRSANQRKLDSYILKIKGGRYGNVSGSKIMCIKTITEKNNGVWIDSSVFDISGDKFVVLPDPPFLYSISNIK